MAGSTFFLCLHILLPFYCTAEPQVRENFMKHLNIFKRALLALLILCSSSVWAYDFEVDGIYYNITDETNKTVEVTDGENKYTGNVVIPSTVIYNSTAYSVTSIRDYAFYYCTGLTSIVIPNSVTLINHEAFLFCSSLTNIEIPNSVTHVGFNAFYGTAWYNNQPDGMVYASKVLYAYKGTMPENTSIAIKEGTIEIAGNAFQLCTGLASVTIPSSVTTIGEWAFQGCSGLKEIYSLAEKPAAIQYDAFDNYSATLYVPYGAKEIYAASVDDWSNFTNIEEIKPEEVTITIGEYGSATYCSEFALDFSNVEGLKAYAATGYNTNTQVVTLTRVQTSKEATGLFLVAEPGEYTVPVIESSADYTLNLLVGVLEQTEVNGASADGNYYNYKYTVAETSDTPQFYQFEDGSSLSAGKAYLQIPASLFPATIAKAISFRFDKSATTDIDEIEGESVTSDAIYFDLNGRRVENPTNGIYIVNGKKVVVNNK